MAHCGAPCCLPPPIQTHAHTYTDTHTLRATTTLCPVARPVVSGAFITDESRPCIGLDATAALQREASYFEAVTQRLSAVARAQQAAQRSVLASLADAAALPLHLLATLAVSTGKLAWVLLLAVTFLLPAALRPPLAFCVCIVLAYAAFLRQVTTGAAIGLAAALVAFIFLPMLVRAVSSRLLTTPTCACCF